MKNRLLTAVVSVGLLFGSAGPTFAVTRHHYRTYRQQVRHRRHMKTAKRVGIGAAGGLAVGALTGHPVAGAVVGAGAGALYDRHEKHHGHN